MAPTVLYIFGFCSGLPRLVTEASRIDARAVVHAACSPLQVPHSEVSRICVQARGEGAARTAGLSPWFVAQIAQPLLPCQCRLQIDDALIAPRHAVTHIRIPRWHAPQKRPAIRASQAPAPKYCSPAPTSTPAISTGATAPSRARRSSIAPTASSRYLHSAPNQTLAQVALTFLLALSCIFAQPGLRAHCSRARARKHTRKHTHTHTHTCVWTSLCAISHAPTMPPDTAFTPTPCQIECQSPANATNPYLNAT